MKRFQLIRKIILLLIMLILMWILGFLQGTTYTPTETNQQITSKLDSIERGVADINMNCQK